MKNSFYRFNLISRIIFLLLTPAIFRYLNFAFVWHSIYWGAVTFVVMLWLILIIISPLFGRIGCGWICFMGTIQDLVNDYPIFKTKRQEPFLWLRIFFTFSFIISAFVFFIINLHKGVISGWEFSPFFFSADFTEHYRHVWLYDTIGALIFGILLNKRWLCKNLCIMGFLCSAGANYSRLIFKIDLEKCNKCRQCEKVCPVGINITDYVINKNGFIRNSECLLCGKCKDVCRPDAIHLDFSWKRKVN